MAPRSTVTLNIGPLKPGRYDFEGEFHAATAKGVLIAEAR
ncbi:cupredoxin domain-containing protein [Acinetobacter baumannii]